MKYIYVTDISPTVYIEFYGALDWLEFITPVHAIIVTPYSREKIHISEWNDSLHNISEEIDHHSWQKIE